VCHPISDYPSKSIDHTALFADHYFIRLSVDNTHTPSLSTLLAGYSHKGQQAELRKVELRRVQKANGLLNGIQKI